ncbi:conserved hypothetical protein [uncultured Dysgonomonas sp.]|nr:hypothetical protein [uncultured Dysgonomonas sp.]SBW06681.1 conserved hypothetical protein [uncultured Dysgonomonas sp.]
MYLQKAILLLCAEIDLLKLIVKPTLPSSHNKTQRYNTKIYFSPNPQGLGTDSMGELATTFELSNQFLDENGKAASFKDITETLEYAFNFSFGNAYKSKFRIFSRKPYNLTKALDYLKKLLIRESRNKKIDKR